MYTTKFNPVQEHLLRMFEFAQSENTLKELKEILFKYYHAKLEQKKIDVIGIKEFYEKYRAELRF